MKTSLKEFRQTKNTMLFFGVLFFVFTIIIATFSPTRLGGDMIVVPILSLSFFIGWWYFRKILREIDEILDGIIETVEEAVMHEEDYVINFLETLTEDEYRAELIDRYKRKKKKP